jgi:acetyl-CoA carboxylase biotin carboxyl carrier protein
MEHERTRFMNLDELKEILQIVQDHQLTEFELERDGLKLKIKKAALPAAPPSNGVPLSVSGAAIAAPTTEAPMSPSSTAVPDEASPDDTGLLELAVVKSPIVGTFYRSPDPAGPAFAEVGDTIRVGQVLCIIEAMKLMNEITSEYEGELTAVYVQNGQAVQYGERLFAIKVR